MCVSIIISIGCNLHISLPDVYLHRIGMFVYIYNYCIYIYIWMYAAMCVYMLTRCGRIFHTHALGCVCIELIDTVCILLRAVYCMCILCVTSSGDNKDDNINDIRLFILCA